MTRFRTLMLLALPLCAAAADPVLLMQNTQTRPGDSSFSFRQEVTASCSAPSVGDCGSCMVSCPVGQAATCKPGKVLAATGDGTCQREPSCTCQGAAQTTPRR